MVVKWDVFGCYVKLVCNKSDNVSIVCYWGFYRVLLYGNFSFG